MSQNKGNETSVGPSYHRLTVKAVHEETADARSFVLVPAPCDTTHYRYTPGQFLSFRVPHDAGMLIRSYSLSSAPGTDPDMTVCVKRVAGGRCSNWFNDHLTTGMQIEATLPAGRFVLGDSNTPLLLIAGGSGITPSISLIKQALSESSRQVKLVYANQNATSVIYSETLDLLEERFAGRFTCHHWLDDDHGFMKAADIATEAEGWERAEYYICGPDPLMDLAEETLLARFGAGATIFIERFVSPDDPSTPSEVSATDSTVDSFRLTLDEEDHRVTISAGETLLQAALAAGVDAPSSCTEGHCGTCLSWLRSGEVTMPSTRALSKRDIERGYVLACQAHPSSSTPIWLDFDI
ncbi:MAG: ferredoxin--NADP reductase [Gammaproteobacteria bacterium]|nr:ferredoxin--NADP reductase [Gammaproteobacteria bacterium]